MLLAVRISSYGCTWEVWRALKKLELLSAAPRAPGGGGALAFFLGGYVQPGTPNWHPVLKKKFA